MPADNISVPPVGIWTPYNPVWTSTGTAPSLGNGTISADYILMGKLYFAWIHLNLGSTTTFGTGTYRLSNPATISALAPVGYGYMNAFDSSAGSFYICQVLADAGNTMAFITTHNPSNIVTNTAPITWASGDMLRVSVMFETT